MRETLSEALGARLRHYRMLRGMSQTDVANLVPVTATYLSDIERGRKLPALEVLIALAEILEVTLDELLRDVFPSSADRYARMILNLFSRCDERQARLLYTVLYSVYDTIQEEYALL